MRFNFRRCSWLSLSSLYFCSGREVGERATQGWCNSARAAVRRQRARGGARFSRRAAARRLSCRRRRRECLLVARLQGSHGSVQLVGRRLGLCAAGSAQQAGRGRGPGKGVRPSLQPNSWSTAGSSQQATRCCHLRSGSGRPAPAASSSTRPQERGQEQADNCRPNRPTPGAAR